MPAMMDSLLPGASMSLAAFTYVQTWVDDSNLKDAVPHVIAKCNEKSLVGSLLKLKDASHLKSVAQHLICTRLAFLDALHTDRAGVGSILIYGSILIPFALRLCYSAASPNRASALQGPVLAMAALGLASMDTLLLGTGLGLFVAPLIALLYTIGAKISAGEPEKRRLIPELPAPTRAIYGANLAILICTVMLGSMSMHDPSGNSESYWWESYARADVRAFMKPAMGTLSDLWPLVVAAPIYLLGYADVERPQSKGDSDKVLREYHPEEIAYGFERTWSYYRQAGLISGAAYIFGVSMIVRCLLQDKTTPSSSSLYLLKVSAVMALAHIGVLVADVASTPESDALDQEGRDAISKAPAGNPGLEDNPKALLILGAFTGPSLPAMLWYAHNEEFRGWKGRRAWRTAAASKAE